MWKICQTVLYNRFTEHAPKKLPSVFFLLQLTFLPIQSLTGNTHLHIHQSALAMVGSASGSLCPASPRAAHNLREGWARAAWYFR